MAKNVNKNIIMCEEEKWKRKLFHVLKKIASHCITWIGGVC